MRSQTSAVRKARMEAFDALPDSLRELINYAPQTPDTRDVQKMVERHGEAQAHRVVRVFLKEKFGVVRGP